MKHFNLQQRKEHFICFFVVNSLFHKRTSAQIATWPYCAFVVVSGHVLIIFKITSLINKPCHKFSLLHNHPFYMQHFCSYLTENMIRINFKTPKSLIYLGENLHLV
jgi:hypothetical protein